MNVQQQVAMTAFFERWFQGDREAMRLAALLTEAAHGIDDVVDDDQHLEASARARILRILLLDIPSCAFYRRNFEYLQPALAATWLKWSAANVMEQEKLPGDREKSYMLRAELYGLYHVIATLTGGLEWAEQVGPEIYRAYGETLESFDA